MSAFQPKLNIFSEINLMVIKNFEMKYVVLKDHNQLFNLNTNLVQEEYTDILDHGVKCHYVSALMTRGVQISFDMQVRPKRTLSK